MHNLSSDTPTPDPGPSREAMLTMFFVNFWAWHVDNISQMASANITFINVWLFSAHSIKLNNL